MRELAIWHKIFIGFIADLEGQMIGRFSVISELGTGGMATVYRAYDPSMKREVAIKVLPLQRSAAGSYRQRFEREARTVANLEHNAIVPVYEFGDHDGQPFLVMRLMSGGSLADRLEKSTISPAEISSILDRMGSALDKAHENGIVHRDLKPANILFDDGGSSYLSDFGIVKVAQETTLTAVGQVVGTPAYMSPEQVMGQADIDGRADIYSLGAILYEMLTGQIPYQATTTMGMAMMHINNPIPQLRDIDPGIPAGYQDVIDKAMAKDRDDRFSSGAEMAAAFVSVSDGAPGVVPLAVAATVVESPTWNPQSAGAASAAKPLPVATMSRPADSIEKKGIDSRIIIASALAAVLFIVILFSLFLWLSQGEQQSTAAERNPTVQALEITLTSQAALIAAAENGAKENRSDSDVDSAGTGDEDTSSPELVADRDGAETSGDVSDVNNDGDVGQQVPVDGPGAAESAQAAGDIAANIPDTTDTAPPAVPPPTEPPPTEPPPPTNTAVPTNTPIPAPTVTPVPTACAVGTAGSFSSIWEAQKTQLGCATSGASAGIAMAVERFVGGRMVWRSDNDKIYAIYSNGTWAGFDDIWNEGDPSFTCGTEQSPPTPQRGFGKIWCTYGSVQQGLGSATDAETGTSGTVQNFENGFIMQAGGQTHTFYYSGTWR